MKQKGVETEVMLSAEVRLLEMFRLLAPLTEAVSVNCYPGS